MAASVAAAQGVTVGMPVVVVEPVNFTGWPFATAAAAL
jgi:hypothetical protein